MKLAVPGRSLTSASCSEFFSESSDWEREVLGAGGADEEIPGQPQSLGTKLFSCCQPWRCSQRVHRARHSDLNPASPPGPRNLRGLAQSTPPRPPTFNLSATAWLFPTAGTLSGSFLSADRAAPRRRPSDPDCPLVRVFMMLISSCSVLTLCRVSPLLKCELRVSRRMPLSPPCPQPCVQLAQ